jgi:hypothetical protein
MLLLRLQPGRRVSFRNRALAKNFDRSTETVAADVFALKTVIAQVLGRIHQLDPILAEAIEGGFEDAASVMRALGASARNGTDGNKVVRAIATIEALEAAALERSQVSDRVRPEVANDNR